MLLLRRARAPAAFRPLCRSFFSRPPTAELVKLFDSQKYFTNFNLSEKRLFKTPNVGLFRNEKLKNPDGLIEFSKSSLKEAKGLVDSMLADASTSEEGRLHYIRKLDQLSDLLCRVIDVAEFIRVVHPSEKWIVAAQKTHEIMFEYMNQLNTNVELYQTLKDILESPLAEKLSSEEFEVGKYLRQDFERSGIAMDPETRANFVAITQEISVLGSQFNNDLQSLKSAWCSVPRHEVEQITNLALKNQILQQSRATRHDDPTTVPISLAGPLPYAILTSCDVQLLRKRIWVALHNSTDVQIGRLDSFLKYRAFLAHMLNYESFAHYQLEHKMAKNPENVITFLKNLQESLLEKEDGVVEEITALSKYNDRAPAADKDILSEVKPWDRDYCVAKFTEKASAEQHSGELAEYLSLGTIFSGLDTLFRSIYNVGLVPVKTQSGETWNPDNVRKLSYVDLATNEVMGYLYVDLWSDKVLPSHFTIVCSRQLNTDLGSESRSRMEKAVHLSSGADYQLPVISLVCNFHRPRSFGADNMPTLLSLDQVDTLFHEMGHATHLMISRTKLHNLSGTRCLTDFVELPSVLMESFSNDPRVLCKIARHYKTGEHLPERLLREHQENRDTLKNSETFMQSKMALLDQNLHNQDVLLSGPNFSSTEVYHRIEKQLRVFSDTSSTWHGKFPHLFSYGAVYYSYLLDRAIAEKVWKGLFVADPWSRQAGEKYRDSILKWGGTRDPWVCLAEALDEPKLASGDAQAMEIIGHL